MTKAELDNLRKKAEDRYRRMEQDAKRELELTLKSIEQIAKLCEQEIMSNVGAGELELTQSATTSPVSGQSPTAAVRTALKSLSEPFDQRDIVEYWRKKSRPVLGTAISSALSKLRKRHEIIVVTEAAGNRPATYRKANSSSLVHLADGE